MKELGPGLATLTFSLWLHSTGEVAPWLSVTAIVVSSLALTTGIAYLAAERFSARQGADV